MATVGLAGDSGGDAEQILPEAAFFNESWKLPRIRYSVLSITASPTPASSTGGGSERVGASTATPVR